MPSKWERLKINKLITGIKSGKIKISSENEGIEEEEEIVFDIWDKPEDELNKKLLPAISAPKMKLPTH